MSTRALLRVYASIQQSTLYTLALLTEFPGVRLSAMNYPCGVYVKMYHELDEGSALEDMIQRGGEVHCEISGGEVVKEGSDKDEASQDFGGMLGGPSSDESDIAATA